MSMNVKKLRGSVQKLINVGIPKDLIVVFVNQVTIFEMMNVEILMSVKIVVVEEK